VLLQVNSVKELQLVPVGQISVMQLHEFEAPILQVLGVESYVGKASLGPPTFAFNKDRGQFHSTAILRRLLSVKDAGAMRILGVTDADLFVPDTPFLFGESDRESHAGVVSIARLRGDTEIARRRVVTEVLHQTGHLIGLSYCEDARCIMANAQSLSEAERRLPQLCNNCKNELQRVRKQGGFL
jgi:archaemetzincin